MNSPRIHPRHLTGFALVVLTTFLVLLGYFWSRSQSNFADKAISSNRAQMKVSTPTPLRSDLPSQARVSESYGKLPLSFEANNGQTDPAVKFISRGSGYSLFLTSTEAVLTLRNGERRVESNGLSSPDSQIRPSNPTSRPDAVLRMKLVGANPDSEQKITGLEELPGRVNYFIGNDPKKWRTNVSTYAKVKYQNIYPGIDVVYYGNQRQLEYDFIIAPGTAPKTITLGFEEVTKLEVDAQGDLVLHTSIGKVRQHKPVVYQEINGARQEIIGAYLLKDEHQVGFDIAAYDTARPLVIDPVLSYSTYLGGSGDDSAHSIAVGSDGSACVSGFTFSTDFPLANPVQPSLSTDANPGTVDEDAFITKLDATGSLIYSTYFGGSNDDLGSGIAVDNAGNAFATGYTRSTDFPTTSGAFQLVRVLSGDPFVTKLNPTGSIIYSTYLGFGFGMGIAVDGSGNAYITGNTSGNGFPTTTGAFQTVFGGGWDAFVAKLNATGSALIYSTYLGGGGAIFESGDSIALDDSGNAYITGQTSSTNFPTANPIQPALGGGNDAFVTKLNTTGSALIYSTYLGGSNNENNSRLTIGGIAVDGGGNAYVTGETFSTNYPTTSGAFQQVRRGDRDAFVTKLDVTGSLVYSTYLGGDASDFGTDIAVDVTGNTFVTGLTISHNFPTTSGAFQSTCTPQAGFSICSADVFVTMLDSTGSGLVFSTYLQGNGNDAGEGIALDVDGNAYVTGWTRSTDFPTVNPFQPAYAGNDDSSGSGTGDAFIVKIGFNEPPVAVNDAYSVAEDNSLTVVAPRVLDNDTDEDGDTLMLMAILVSGPAHGTLTLNANGSFSYTPTTNFNGTDSFTYKATDGTLVSNTATVVITITPVNDPPVAVNNPYSVAEDNSLTIVVPGMLANDTDVDGDTLMAILVSGPTHGTLTLNANGSFSYTPATNFNGTDNFTYKATDGTLFSNTATVVITITPVNDPPVALADGPYLGIVGATVQMDASSSSDPEGNLLTFNWTFGDGTSLTTTQAFIEHTYASTGTFTVTLIVNDGQIDSAPFITQATITSPFGGGGQRNDVDDFLTYANPLQRSIELPTGTTSFNLTIIYGPTIIVGSFQAILNGNLFTGFHPIANTSETITITLYSGRNTLQLQVDGVRSDGRTARDRDQLTFIVP